MSTLNPPIFSFEDTLGQHPNMLEPILFIITPGADPSQELRDFAKSTQHNATKYHEIAMGQGQGEIAIQTIRKAANAGEWVCLQNVHLVISWLTVLEKELLSIEPKEGFRLWLTSEAHLKFPPTLLEKCLKITVEAPPGNFHLM